MRKTINDDIKHIYDASLFDFNDLDILLHETLKQTRDLLNAEAGSIYIKENNDLTFNVFQNDTFSYEDIYKQFFILKDLKLPIDSDEKYLAVESLKTNKIIIIDDVYNSSEFEFLGVKEFDKKFNYNTHSIITAPLIHPITNKGLGVIQIINKKDSDDNYVLFNEKDKNTLSMACSFVALSISKVKQEVVKLEVLNNKLAQINETLEEKIKIKTLENEKKSAIIYTQSKMVSMGEMIGNIAHQWRQPLNTINAVASALDIRLDLKEVSKEEISSNMNHIMQTIKHLSQTIDDFRDFYKINKHKEEFDIEESIRSCINIVDASLSINNIKTIFKPKVRISIKSLKNEFSQSMINLLSNAKDALCENINKDEERLIFIDLYKSKNQIVITIKDNAGGIENSILGKIFDQHFTTKYENGNGIGLFMSKQIIEEHMNGSLEAKNTTFEYNGKEYNGAEFMITLTI